MEQKQSLLPPSYAHIWGNLNGCHGWVHQNHNGPKPAESEAKKTARAVKTLAGEMILSYSRAGVNFPLRTNHDPVMWDAAKAFADDAHDYMVKCAIMGGEHFILREYVQCPSIHSEVNGMVDFALYDESHRWIGIWLLHNGHRPMEARENNRLLCYLSGLMDRFNIDGKADQTLNVMFRIVQPNCYSVQQQTDVWTFAASDARGLINRITESANRSMSGVQACRSGSYCTTCPQRFNCAAAIESALTVYEASMQPYLKELSSQELSIRYELIKRVHEQSESLKTAYKQQIESLLRSGVAIPGQRLEPKFGKLDWKENPDFVASVGDMYGKDIRKPGLMTPLQAIKAGIPEEIVMAYAERKQSGFDVVPEEKLLNQARVVLGPVN